jgi:hypothetical protein
LRYGRTFTLTNSDPEWMTPYSELGYQAEAVDPGKRRSLKMVYSAGGPKRRNRPSNVSRWIPPGIGLDLPLTTSSG